MNPWAGEVVLSLDGVAYRCRLTLGSLAALEAGLQAGGLLELVQRFETGRFSASDLLAVLLAGLRGGGWEGGAEELAAAEIGGGVIEAAGVAARLLARAFALPGEA